MFADGNTNLFCKSKVVKTLFLKANIKFEKKIHNGFRQTNFL